MSQFKVALQLFSLVVITLFLYSCVSNVDLEANVAYKINITSSPVTAVTSNSAVCGGTVNSTGGVDLIERGVRSFLIQENEYLINQVDIMFE